MNTVFGFISNVGPYQLLIILIIILLLFGAKKLPELARGLGKATQEFKKATRDVEDNFRDAMSEDDSSRKSNRTETKPPKSDDDSEEK